jgi:hypothetical protein
MSIKIKKSDFPKLFLNKSLNNEYALKCLQIGYNLLYGNQETPEEILQQQMLHKTKSDILSTVSLNSSLTNSRLQNIESKFDSLNIDSKLNNMNDIMQKLFGISNNSYKRGDISEEIIYQLFSTKFKNYSYEKKGHIPHSGDGELTSPNNMKLLVELKNYSHPVPKKEVDKFLYDMNYTGNQFGIFISLQSNIISKKGIQFDTYMKEGKKLFCVFICNAFEELSRIESGILILENIQKFNDIMQQDKKLLDTITDRVNENLLGLNDIVNKLGKMKQQYQDMEKNIKSELDGFYVNIRDYELEVKTKIDQIMKNTLTDLKKIEGETTCKTEWDKVIEQIPKKIKKIIVRLSDILISKDLRPSVDKKIITLLKGAESLYYMKLQKEKVIFYNKDNNFNIEFKSKNLNSTCNLLNTLL